MAVIVHVTHEAVHQSGGIGTVLRGLIAAPTYAGRVERTLLLGPLADPQSSEPLGVQGEVLYDGGRGIGTAEYGASLGRVQAAFGTRLVYGRRRLGSEDREARPEVLLVDVQQAPHGLGTFKYFLGVELGLDSRRYEHEWEYEQYLRLAEPGFEAVRALLGEYGGICWIVAHEFMGLGTAFKALLAGDGRFRTAFYAHEVATMRILVEQSPGRDIMFYNVLRIARRTGGYVEDFFGSQDGYYKHALVRRAWRCHAVLAVGDRVVEELAFLGPEFAHRHIDLVYNGVPAVHLSADDKARARARLQSYAGALLGFAPDLVFTHVTRLVKSKGLWRDLLVLEHLDELLVGRRKRAVFVVLATEVGRRPPQEVERMARSYGWPLVHREGFPDLSGSELEFDLAVRAFNARSTAVKVIFVNQFGWDRASCGPAMPEDMEFMDLRRGSDAEFGQSIYEPFGIAQVEPLSFGALSVVSDVCGCIGYVERVGGGRRPRAFIAGEYTRLEAPMDLGEVRHIGREQSQRAERQESQRVAARVCACLPSGKAQVHRLLEEGFAVASAMSWERVAQDLFLPALERVDRL